MLTSAGLQVEIWIHPATALPARMLVIYTDHPVRPHFTAEYSDWKIDPKLPASTLALPRPAGAKQVDFREPAVPSGREQAMQTRHLAAALCLLALISPGAAAAVVVVRHPVYVASSRRRGGAPAPGGSCDRAPQSW